MDYQQPPSSPVVVDYILNNRPLWDRTSRIVAVTVGRPDRAPTRYVSFDDALVVISRRPRIYYDATDALAIEMRHDLYPAPDYDDVRAMLLLLDQRVPAVLIENSDSNASSFERVAVMQRLAPQLLAQIDAQDLGYVYRQIELPVAIPTAAMSLSGIRVNVEVLEGIRDSHEVQVEIARRRFQDIADPRINLDSSSEVADYLLDELNLPVPPRTNNAALRPLAGAHRAVPIIIAYQEHKAVRDAAQALLSHRTPDGQVYAQLDPLGTATGRFSCSRPNLLGLAAPVLQAIEASPGCLLLEADYSQMELRVLAHFSQDAALLHAFQHDEDLHRRTAARVLGIAEEAVNVEQRGLGKTLNFAIVFGMTAVGLADELGRTPQEAEELLAAYHRTYPGIAAWVAAVHEQVAATGEVRTLYGRRRYLPNISSTYDYQVAAARRQAVNTVIQGTAADLLKLALVRLNETLPEKVRMLLPVHDSVLLEVPAELEDETRRIVVEAMQAAPPGFTIPLKVDVTTGRTWAECKAR